MISASPTEMLHRAGVIQERAKRAGRSLDAIERTIVYFARQHATEAGYSRTFQNATEMEGQTNFDVVLKKLTVVAKFAYYDQGYEDIPPHPSFLIIESNHPTLPVNGNVSIEEFEKAGVKVPKMPTYEKWVKAGRPVYRGERR